MIANMRRTLRRSCNACAGSKLSCDLRKPMCSRCVKRKIRRCVYVNEPLTLPLAGPVAAPDGAISGGTIDIPVRNTQLVLSHASLPQTTIGKPLDQFNSLPQTRLPRARVLQLIQHFLSNIAFQYYPLDLEKSSNPFVVSWWPLALNDPALFHVSLQTASLDLDLKAQNGFANSEILMADSIALVRRRVENQSLACGDETIDSVVTLAAIEFGKGNITVSSMHIEGVKRMVQLRGGIHSLKLESPLTARMVAWVSMVLMQQPQFEVQNDQTRGDAIAPTKEWVQIGESYQQKLPLVFYGLGLEPTMSDVITRLRTTFDMSREQALSTTDLHDLTCFILHRLLSLPSPPLEMTAADAQSACLRYSVALYMLLIHGPTYFTHAHLQSNLVSKLKDYMTEALGPLYLYHGAIAVWIVSVGLVASADTTYGPWFLVQAKAISKSLNLGTWPNILVHLETVLWYTGMPHAETMFRQRWETILHET